MSKIVSMSEAASIAVHAMVLIARSEKNVNVNLLAEKTGASKNHIAKVMQRLVKQNLIKSTRGPTGGFVLGRSASKINLLEIYESIEGQIQVEGCPMEKQVCPFDKCLMGGIANKLSLEFKNHLKKQTLNSYMDS
jgi:Rrf2 family protein